MNFDIRRHLNRENGRWLLTLALFAGLTFSFRSAVADWNDVPTGSMQPTILIGDRIFVNKLAYDLKVPFTQHRLATWGEPARGDIVVCWSPADGKRLVKRVVGVPGDLVAMKQGRLELNGEILDLSPADQAELTRLLGKDGPGKRFFREDLAGVDHVVAWQPARGAARNFGPVRIPADRFFVMGDNRDNSADSRFFGLVTRDQISGRAEAVVFSLDHGRWFLPRPGRLFTRLG